MTAVIINIIKNDFKAIKLNSYLNFSRQALKFAVFSRG